MTDRIVNTLLCHLDGVEGTGNITVVVSTARPDLIDKALIRPGRIDLHLFCDIPNQDEKLNMILSKV